VDDSPGGDIQDGTVTTTQLAAPNYTFMQQINCANNPDALTAGAIATAQVGVGAAGGLTDEAFPFKVPVDCTLLLVTTSNNASAGTCTATVHNLTTALDLTGASAAFTTTVTVQSGVLALSMLAASDYAIHVDVSAGGNDGVVTPQVWLTLRAVHQTS